MNILSDTSTAFLMFFEIFLVMEFSADCHRIDNLISESFVDVKFSLLLSDCSLL